MAPQGGEEGREVGWLEGEVGEIQDREAGGALQQLQDFPVTLCGVVVIDAYIHF